MTKARDIADRTFNTDANFGDNDKAIFGAGSDLQIYHDGTHSRIVDAGSGNLSLQGNDLRVKNADASKTYISAANGGALDIRYDDDIKLATTSTGVDVTGTVTAGGLTVDGGGNLNFYGGTNDAQYIKFGDTDDADVGNIFYYHGNNNMVFTTNASEAMRIDSSGVLSVGGTNATAKLNIVGQGGSNVQLQNNIATGTGGVVQIGFINDNGLVGSIQTSGTSTSYVTSSDYRLKENLTDITDATTRLKQLNPVRFNFITDPDTTVDGFLAHEVQDVVPEAISGTKDAMRDEEYEVTPAVLDEDGNVVTPAVMGTRSVPDYQGIDQSKLVPLLVKTIQELEARITALETV